MSKDSGLDQTCPITSSQTQGHQNRSPERQRQQPHHHITFGLDDYFLNETQKLVESNWKEGGVQTSNSEQIQPEALAGKLTKRQFLILLVFTFTQFGTGAVISLQAPFYPAEAEKKGLTASEYGLVFGIFELTVFAVSFLYGKYISRVGPKFVYNLGLLVLGISAILFGTLDHLEDRIVFFAMSLITRVVEAIGAAACLTGAFTIIALEFSNSVATTFATMEMLLALGLACGPVIGGALYQLGGFPLPFYVVGTLLVFMSIFVFFVLPTPKDLNLEGQSSKGLLDLLRIPEVAVSTLVIITAALTIGYLSATLEPHIRDFNLNSVSVGLVMVIGGATYAIVNPFWGQLCDKKPVMTLYMLMGCAFTILGFVFIAPSPFFPFDKMLWLTCVGLVFHGIGLGGSLVSSFLQCLASANAHGFPDNTETFSLTSGLWVSSFSLGNFIGPTVAGILYDTVGFRNGTFFVNGVMLIVGMVLVCLMCSREKVTRGYRNPLSEFTESAPLLGYDRAKTIDSRKR